MKNKYRLYIPASFLWAAIIFVWTYILGNMSDENIGSHEIVGAVFLSLTCSSYLVGLGRKIVVESNMSSAREMILIDRGSVCFPWLTIMSCLTVAWGLSQFVTELISIKYSYLIGSFLFLPTFVIIFMRRRDLRMIMIIFGSLGIPFGCLTEYFFYGKDWWNATRVFGFADGRLGLADIIYSFFHGALLPVSGLFFTQTKLSFDRSLSSTFKKLLGRGIILATTVFVVIWLMLSLTKLPSFYIVGAVFFGVGIVILTIRKDLLRLSVSSAILTLCWSTPVYFIVNTVSPGWIESFWLEDTDKVRILDIPLLDLIWYTGAGFGAGAILPFILNARVRLLHSLR